MRGIMAVGRRLERTARRTATAFAVGSVMLASVPAPAAQRMAASHEARRPSGGEMVIDAAVARPLGAVAAVGGTALFFATLPFSLLGGNTGEAAEKLMLGPTREAFVRCLGCRSAGRDRGITNAQGKSRVTRHGGRRILRL